MPMKVVKASMANFLEEWKVILLNLVEIETLWKMLDGKRDREKIAKICTDIHESNHALKASIESNSNGDCINTSALPWLLTEQQSDALKEVIKKIKFPTGFAANISTLVSKKGDFGLGLKTNN